MKLVKMIRSSPELPGGPTSCKVQLQDVAALEARGYVQDGEAFDFGEPVTSEKAALVAKALELELGTEEELNAMTEEELTQAIADASDDGNTADKDALIAKALELKIASQSALARMSVKKLQALIAEKAQA